MLMAYVAEYGEEYITEYVCQGICLGIYHGVCMSRNRSRNIFFPKAAGSLNEVQKGEYLYFRVMGDNCAQFIHAHETFLRFLI